jgi:hypothetical protein
VLVRILPLLLALTLVAGCTEDGEPSPTTSVTAPASSTTEVLRQEYSYGFQIGQELDYRLDLQRRIVLDSEGTSVEVVAGDLPGQADVTVSASGLFTYTVGQGPQEGTYLLTIEGGYDEMEVTGTIDGETVEDPGQVGELLSLGPESTTLVVDSAGHVLESVWGGAPNDSPTPGTSGGAAGFMGPILPPDPLGMGETWGETFTEMAMGAAEVEGVLEGRLAGPGEDDEVIFENVKTTAAGEIDMAPFYRDFLLATAEEGEEIEGLDQLAFRIAIDPSETRITGWIDPDRGLPLRTTVESATRTATESTLPDPDTGELQSFEMRIGVEQSMTYELVAGDSG